MSRQHFATKEEVRREIGAYIDFCSNRRRHSSCEMTSPVAYEQVLAERAAGEATQSKAA